jgi:enoyl-CoA hydratase
MTDDPEILIESRGRLGLITLNRPAALNALTLGMVRAMRSALDRWAADPAIASVAIRASGSKAFCAGGDILTIYRQKQAGHPEESLIFWAEEYALNRLIKRYPKPYLAFIDGIVMGGGVGVSIHGSHRVAGEKFQFAMPEVGIGFFPDVGATWLLPHMPGETGTYCALTGERLKTADAVATGIATHHVASARFPELLDGLCGTVRVDALLAAFAEPAGDSALIHRSAAIDRLFVDGRVEDILARLDSEAERGTDASWAGAAAARIRTKSPTSLKIALAQMRRGKTWSFTDCMRAEFRIVSRLVHGHDFYEGIRAVIIDKDNLPRWKPATLEAVSEVEVERHFAPLVRELELK